MKQKGFVCETLSNGNLLVPSVLVENVARPYDRDFSLILGDSPVPFEDHGKWVFVAYTNPCNSI